MRQHRTNSQRLVAVSTLGLLGRVGLVLAEEVGAEDDVSGLVDTVDVTKAGSDGEAGGDGAEGLVDVVNVFGLGVERGVVDRRVVDTVLLTTSDTNLHLEPEVDLGHALKVLYAELNVLLLWLLREVEHVGGEEGLSVLLEVSLVGLEHAVEPWQELLGTVVRVEHDGDAVRRGDSADVGGGGAGTGNGGSLVSAVGETLAAEEGGAALGDLEDDGRVDIAGSLEDGVDDGGRGDVLA